MYNSQETNIRIRKLAKEKGIQMSGLQEKCGLSKNTIMQSGKSQDDMKAKNLYAIAELLECSVDYLLGRVTNPTEIYQISYPINTALDNDTSELIELIQDLPLVDRSKAIVYLHNLKNRSKNKSKSQIVTENEQSLHSIISDADESLVSFDRMIKNLEKEQALRDADKSLVSFDRMIKNREKEQALREEEDRKLYKCIFM